MREINIVLGLGSGDEGKGATVNSLCYENPKDSLVIRFCGGHQCGHSVVHNDIQHVFSNFGSGTLQGVPTYWSEYCTVNPPAVIKEGNALKEKGIIPFIYYNANALVITPFDIIQNLYAERENNHGTVGVGFGTTIQRNEDHYHLYVRDLYYPRILEAKLKNILSYYKYTLPLNSVSQKYYDDFINACQEFVRLYICVNGFNELVGYNDDNLIFEGGQGIMLDQDYGFFPNVTRSYTTSRNAIEFIGKYILKGNIKTYYVTRAYQTRHGRGYMSNEGMDISYIKPNPLETNVDTGYQGKFRKAPLDLDTLKYALHCDGQYNVYQKKIVITCLDQIDGDLIPITKNNTLLHSTSNEIGKWLDIFDVLTSNSDKGFI